MTLELYPRESLGSDYLRMRLNICHAGIITSFRILPLRPFFSWPPFAPGLFSLFRSSLSGTKRSCTMLVVRLRKKDGMGEGVVSVTVGSGVTVSVCIGENVPPVGVDSWEELSSVVSTWEETPLDIESKELSEFIVVRRFKCLLTSMRLLKYSSKQSSKVIALPSPLSSGIATSSNLSLINL